jgi:hypothetical protein
MKKVFILTTSLALSLSVSAFAAVSKQAGFSCPGSLALTKSGNTVSGTIKVPGFGQRTATGYIAESVILGHSFNDAIKTKQTPWDDTLVCKYYSGSNNQRFEISAPLNGDGYTFSITHIDGTQYLASGKDGQYYIQPFDVDYKKTT